MMSTANTNDLLDPEFITRLERLEIVSRKIFQGKVRGERRSKRRGESVEFADHRNYVVGDDLRFLDWNIYARLDRLFLKLFLEEEDLHVNILLDASASMDWGEPSKALYAKRIAASIGYIGLCNNDRVSIYAHSNGITGELAGMRSKRMLPKMLDFLGSLKCTGPSHLAQACKHFSMRHPQPGILMIIGDFLDKGGFEDGVRMIIGRKFDAYCIQILSPDEIDPKLTGELKLTDVEDDDVAEVSISRALIDRYKHNLKAYCQSIREYCTRRGVSYMFTGTDVDFDQVVLTYLRRKGLLR